MTEEKTKRTTDPQDMRTPEALEHYRDLAAATVARDPSQHTNLNIGAKVALESIREGFPHLPDEDIMLFMSSVTYMMARIQSCTVVEVVEITQGIFDHYVLGIASMLGVYDLNSNNDTDGRTIDEIYADMVSKRHRAEASKAEAHQEPGMYL